MAKDAQNAAKPRKKHTLLKIFFVLMLAAAVGAALVYVEAKNEISGVSSGETATVTIEQGSGVAAIARDLKQAGVIKYPRLFRWYVGRKSAANTLQYGEFSLEKGASYDAIIQALSVYAKAESVRLTFPEGSTALAIAQKLEDAGLCSAENFLEEANTGDFSDFAFWQDVPDDENAPGRVFKCEGYLFPDTYDFLTEDTVHNYVATFYARFEQQITEEISDELDRQGMTLNNLITLASLVQEEAGNEQNSNVAQVFRNRLAEDSPYPMLQSNASSSIQNEEDNNYLYNWVAPYYGGWENIPEETVAAYDTYARVGLPVGPISNPGLAAIQAALDPTPDADAENCYFFVTDQTGRYYYAETLAGHNANCAKAAAVNKSLAASSGN